MNRALNISYTKAYDIWMNLLIYWMDVQYPSYKYPV